MRKLRINLESSISNRAATVSIWIDSSLVENVISVMAPWTKDYNLGNTNTHTIRIRMDNDYTMSATDLNLLVRSIQISDTNGVFSTYDYLVPDAAMNLRTEDNSNLLLSTLWGTPNEFNMQIDEANLITWHDYYQENLDNG